MSSNEVVLALGGDFPGIGYPLLMKMIRMGRIPAPKRLGKVFCWTAEDVANARRALAGS
jgi:hypothetical protein